MQWAAGKKTNLRAIFYFSSTEEIHYQEQFLKIVQAFGQSFLQPDLNIFRQNVTALENLNVKWKLFSKRIFMESLSHQVF